MSTGNRRVDMKDLKRYLDPDSIIDQRIIELVDKGVLKIDTIELVEK